MNKIIVFFSILFFSLISFAQNAKFLNGTVLCENNPIQKIEIINLTTEKIVFSDLEGHFQISINIGDKLTIGNSFYNYQNFTISKINIEKSNFIVTLTKKIVELEEVVVTDLKIKPIAFNQGKADEIKVLKDNRFASSFNSQNPIPNGADLMRLGKDVFGVFKKLFNVQPKEKPEIIKIDFKGYAAQNLKPNYIEDDLGIKPDNAKLFFDFCDADNNAKTVFESNNVLVIMDFLKKKSRDFKTFYKK